VSLDVTLAGAKSIVHELYGDMAPQIIKSRFQIITSVRNHSSVSIRISESHRSVWKSLRVPVRDWPLALCDAASVDQADLVDADVIYPNYLAENRMVHFNEGQKWYWLPDQAANEILVFKAVDTEYRTSHGESRFF
jgi:hypothetical protein